MYLLFYSYAETLSQNIGGLGAFSLQYNATIANNSEVLENVEGIIGISCYKHEIVLYLSPESSASSFAMDFQNGTLIHGGTKWGCTDEHGQEKPFYFAVSSTDVEMNDDTIIFHG